MGKQARVLEHEPDASAIGGHEDALGGIDQDAVVEHDAAAIGARQPGDQADGHRLAGAGAAEQGGDAGIAREGDGEIESAELQRDVNTDHAARSVASSDIYISPYLPASRAFRLNLSAFCPILGGIAR